MRKVILAAGLATGVMAVPAHAGGGYCSPEWRPENPAKTCASQIAIAPGNDTRVNLYMLMHDRAETTGEGLSLPDSGWGSLYGKNFFKWGTLRETWLPRAKGEKPQWNRGSGTRCQTMDSGKAAFLAAMDRNRRLKDRDKARLTELREQMAEACATGPGSWEGPGEGGFFANVRPKSIKRDPANGYLAYLEASAAFYGGQWQRATEYYTVISKRTRDPWLKETSKYMQARTQLNQTIDVTTSKWGTLQRSAATREGALATQEALLSYLSAYPKGQYAGSAHGLMRKAIWLQGDTKALNKIYSRLVAKTDPATEAGARLVEELEYTFPAVDAVKNPMDPLLLATQNLQRMRIWDRDYIPENLLTAEELAAQESAFADHPELFSFLQASHAFHVAQDFRDVLKLVPDAAREDSYSPLAFSRQHLRGLALHALGDRNEEGFWLDLIKRADGPWQRQSVELALARLYEQQGQLNKVFANGSPIADPTIRRILLGQSADLATLKRVARDGDLTDGERSFSLYTALLKQLQHGQYQGLLEDFPLIEQFGSGEQDQYGHWDLFDRAVAPVKTFTEGTWTDGYPCPTLKETVRTLAKNSRDIDARLCMGDFIRLNGFDQFDVALNRFKSRENEGPAALGSKSFYEGERLHRLNFYKSIIADRRASADQRAYALYRGVWCFGPTGNNSCGSDVPVATRAAWFRRLKRDYPNSQWAKDLKHYW